MPVAPVAVCRLCRHTIDQCTAGRALVIGGFGRQPENRSGNRLPDAVHQHIGQTNDIEIQVFLPNFVRLHARYKYAGAHIFGSITRHDDEFGIDKEIKCRSQDDDQGQECVKYLFHKMKVRNILLVLGIRHKNSICYLLPGDVSFTFRLSPAMTTLPRLPVKARVVK